MDYATLKATVADYLGGRSLSAIDTFIDLAESHLNKVLRLSQQESIATATLTGAYLALPADMLEVRTVRVDGRTVSYMTPEAQDRKYGSTGGTPRVYCVQADQFRFSPVPSSGVTVEIDYYQSITPLDSTNTTNFVSTNWPEVYLFYTLYHAFMFIRNMDQAAVYKNSADAAIATIVKENQNRKYGGALIQRAVE